MKKILLSILLLTASTLIYSQSMDLNHKKIHIVDSTMGLGITPTSRLHIFGNGTSSNMFNLTNDKDGVKDSSIGVTNNGSFYVGTNAPYNGLVKNTFMIRDFNQGENTVWIDSTTTDSNLIHVNKIISMNSNAKGVFGIGGATYGTNADFRNSFFISSVGGSLHLANEYYVKATIATNGVGIGMISPNAALDVRDRWGASYVFKAGNDLDDILDSSIVSTIDGKVGIGTANPSTKLHIVSNEKSAGGLYSVYTGDVNYPAIAGHVSGSYGTAVNGTVDKGGIAGNFYCYSNGIGLKVGSISGYAIVVTHGDIVTDSTRHYNPSTTLSDNEILSLPTGYSWKGEIDVDSLGYSLFTVQVRCDVNGTVYIEGVSWKRWSSITYIENGTTDGYFNIYDAGSGMAIKNSLGYTIKATLRFRTKQ